MNSILDLSAADLRRAANLQEKIQDLQKELNRLFQVTKEANVTNGRRKRRHMSASTKAKLAAIARARWKKAKAAGKAAL